MPRFVWPVVFTLATPAALVASFLLLYSLHPTTPPTAAILPPPQVLSATAQAEPSQLAIQSTVTVIDGRPLILGKYLKSYRSPLESIAADMVKLSDKYGIDYRLLVAIARQESALCKHIPPGSNNCWGHGIYGDKVTHYPTLLAGSEAVLKTLVKYKRDGLDTPEEIMRRYTPTSAGSWAAGVSQFLADLE